MDNFYIIYKILEALENSLDVPEFNDGSIAPEALGASKERLDRCVEMALDGGLIKGFGCGMRITLSGLEYLGERSLSSSLSRQDQKYL